MPAAGARLRAAMKADLAAHPLYLVSGVLFILALKGLSSRASSRVAGNRNGMIGMAIAGVNAHAVGQAMSPNPVTWAW